MQRLNFFCKRVEEAQNCLEISFAREKNLIFLRFSEVRFSPFTSQVYSSFLKRTSKTFGFGNSNGKRYRELLSLL